VIDRRAPRQGGHGLRDERIAVSPVVVESDARIKALQAQVKGASDRTKARVEKRIAEVKADFEVRSKKLNQAWTLTKEALAA
jgi:hypothetical protein